MQTGAIAIGRTAKERDDRARWINAQDNLTPRAKPGAPSPRSWIACRRREHGLADGQCNEPGTLASSVLPSRRVFPVTKRCGLTDADSCIVHDIPDYGVANVKSAPRRRNPYPFVIGNEPVFQSLIEHPGS